MLLLRAGSDVESTLFLLPTPGDPRVWYTMRRTGGASAVCSQQRRAKGHVRFRYQEVATYGRDRPWGTSDVGAARAADASRESYRSAGANANDGAGVAMAEGAARGPPGRVHLQQRGRPGSGTGTTTAGGTPTSRPTKARGFVPRSSLAGARARLRPRARGRQRHARRAQAGQRGRGPRGRAVLAQGRVPERGHAVEVLLPRQAAHGHVAAQRPLRLLRGWRLHWRLLPPQRPRGAPHRVPGHGHVRGGHPQGDPMQAEAGQGR